MVKSDRITYSSITALTHTLASTVHALSAQITSIHIHIHIYIRISLLFFVCANRFSQWLLVKESFMYITLVSARVIQSGQAMSKGADAGETST